MRAAPLLLLACVSSLTLLACDGATPAPNSPDSPASDDEQPLAVDEAPDADPNVERLTLRAGRYTFRDARLEGERLWGPRTEVAHFPDGYRGKSRRGFLFLSEKTPGHVSGTIGQGALTNVDYEEDPKTHRLVSKGRWAASAFGLELDHDTIVINRRFCTDTYRRVKDTDVFHGVPECWRGGRLGAEVHVPPQFFQRPPGEQVVFLSTFLS